MLRQDVRSRAPAGAAAVFGTLIVAAWFVLGPAAVHAAETEPLAARQQAARALVQEALQREIYGLSEERQTLLEEAQRRDSVSQAAKWHQGLVQTPHKTWTRPEEFALDASSKALLKEYRETRDKTADTVRAQLALANWCAERELPHQERAHLWRVITLDAEHAPARRRLGFVQVGKEWFTVEDAAREQAAQVARAEALAKYREPLQEIVRDLQHRSLAKQSAGRRKLGEIADPAAIPAIEEALGSIGGEISALAIEKISQFDDQEATLTLCRFAVAAPTEQTRKLAANQLRGRNKPDFIPQLLDLLSLPLQTRFAAVALPDGTTNYQHVVVQEGRERRDVAIANQQYVVRLNVIPQWTFHPGAPGLRRGPALAREATAGFRIHQQKEYLKQASLTAMTREAQIKQMNAIIAQTNRQVMSALEVITGQQYMSPDGWWNWWTQEIDRQPQEKYTSYMQRDKRRGIQVNYSQRMNPTIPSCFAAGTQVWTVDGTAAIESLRVGDLVLSKDIQTGELCYKPVLETTVRPPSPIVTFNAGNDRFQTSRGHLFWEPGSGWTQARRLQSGMLLHTATNPIRVCELGEAPAQPTYNLVVADFHTYFVGEEKLLSHDVTEEEPTDVVVPGMTGD